MAEPSTCLFIGGLPLNCPQDFVKQVIEQYAFVKSLTMLAPQPDGGCCLCETESLDQPLWFIQNLNGSVPNGLQTNISVRYAFASDMGKIELYPTGEVLGTTWSGAGGYGHCGMGKGGNEAGSNRYSPFGFGVNSNSGNAFAVAGGCGPCSRCTGVVKEDKGNFGFITMDSGAADVFALNNRYGSSPLPPVGSRVSFEIIMDVKTGRPRAEHIQLEGVGGNVVSGNKGNQGGCGCGGPKQNVTQPSDAILTGTVLLNKGQFGFIEQDNGDANMFCMPQCCRLFNNVIPDVGTKVQYKVVLDEKTGRTRADNVGPVCAEQSTSVQFGVPMLNMAV
jgi:cold shock CspA family protein